GGRREGWEAPQARGRPRRQRAGPAAAEGPGAASMAPRRLAAWRLARPDPRAPPTAAGVAQREPWAARPPARAAAAAAAEPAREGAGASLRMTSSTGGAAGAGAAGGPSTGVAP